MRGLEFQAAPLRFEITGSPDILDANGRQVELPTLRPSSDQAAEDRQQAEVDTDRKLLLAMLAEPNATQQQWSETVGRSKSIINRKLQRLQRDKLVEQSLGKWSVTAKGRKAVEEAP